MTITTSTSQKWTQDTWDKLEGYLIEFGNLNPSYPYLYDFQLQFLAQYLASDIETIIINIQQLTLKRDNYSRNNFNWEKNKTKLMDEVDNIIASFKSQQFKTTLNAPGHEEAKLVNVPQSLQAMNRTVVPILAEQKDILKREIPIPKIDVKTEMPTLSKTQRRMSLDLMHTKPQDIFTPKRTNSLSKPALTGTSVINVLTKADMSNNKVGFTNTKKFNLTLIVPQRLAGRAKVIEDVDDKGKDEDFKQENKVGNMSFVSENLPQYIKTQLVLSKHKLPRMGQSRMKNILSNSQSLYAHNKDSSSLESENQGNSGISDYHGPGISESDDDREYILPNLLTKFLGLQENENEDNIDFLDIDDDFPESQTSVSDDQQSDNDEYLFKI